MADLKITQNAFEDQKKLLEEMKTIRFTSRCIPPEILRMIFLHAVPPLFLIDSSIAGGPESPWCQALRMKKSIVGVSRAWCEVGIEVLYKDVAFRRIGQISALLRTLEARPDDFRNLVRGITVNCFVPRGYAALFHTELKRIFEHCPRVAHFAFNPSFSSPLPYILPVINSPITHLDCGATITFSSVLASLMNVSGTLVSLSFHLPNTEQEVTLIHFDRLKTLRCGVQYDSRENLRMVEAKWKMPRLERLTFELDGDQRTMSTYLYRSFFIAHGRCLKFLSIRLGPWGRKCSLAMQPLLDQCPILEHLVLQAHSRDTLAHPTVKWIDLWSPHVRNRCIHPWVHVNFWAKEAFPALQGVRTLDVALVNVPDLATMMPPDAVVNGDAFDRFPGIHIWHSRDRLIRRDLMYIRVFEGGDNSSDDDYDSDSDYSPSEGHSSSDDDQCDGSDASCATDSDSEGDLDEFYSKETWEADHDAALTAYLQTLE